MRCFCSSVPNCTTGFQPKIFIWTAEAPLSPAPDWLIGCILIAASVIPKPHPPYSPVIQIPSQPSPAQRREGNEGRSRCRSPGQATHLKKNVLPPQRKLKQNNNNTKQTPE